MQKTALKQFEAVPSVLAAQEPELTLLRMLMHQCRAKPRVDVFETCAFLLNAPKQDAQDYADALLRSLTSALPKGPVIHTIGATERSFDENWLLALFAAIRRTDHASASFLLRARLPLHLNRPVGWLAAQLVRRIPVLTEGCAAHLHQSNHSAG